MMAKIADADVQLTCGGMKGILSIFQRQGGFFSQRCPAFIQAGKSMYFLDSFLGCSIA